MGEFTKRVQANKIPGPLRRAFNRQAWENELQAHGSDADDEILCIAGLEIHLKLTNIRNNLKVSTNPDLSATTKLRALIACSNHPVRVLVAKTQEAIAAQAEKQKEHPDAPVMMHELMATKIELPGGF